MFHIADKNLGKDHPVFIVAEVSANHKKDFDLAVKMIHAAKECGADAVKFQTYTPDGMTLDLKNEWFMLDHPKWGGQSLYDLYESAYTPWEWFPELKKVCDDCGITFFSTAFDRKSVDYLEQLDVPVHKIASFELTDIPLIKYMAQTKKPLIMSTGMASDDEIDDAVEAARSVGAEEILLLKCVSSYPAQPDEMNLRTINTLQKKYDCEVGFSDHTLDEMALISAVTLGAVFIEKHFILDKTDETPDSFFSIDPDGLASLVKTVRTLEQGLGGDESKTLKQEETSNIFRRSLFVVKDVAKGESFSEDNIRSIRPGMGIKPKYLEDIKGKSALQDIKKGTPLDWKYIEGGELH